MSAKIARPNYTQLPNTVLDNLSIVSDAELRVLLVVCRQTFGWQRGSAKLSISFIAKAAGMSDRGVSKGTKSLLDRGVLARDKDGDGFAYFLVVSPEDPRNGVPSPSEPGSYGAMNGVPSPPRNGVPTNKETGIKKQEGTAPKRELTDAWCAAYQEAKGRKYLFEGAKDGRAADRLLAHGLTTEHVIEVAKKAWGHPDWFNCKQAATLSGFASRYNDICAELESPPVNGRRTEPPKRDMLTGQLVAD